MKGLRKKFRREHERKTSKKHNQWEEPLNTAKHAR